jgi:indolepyruvate ferredoxin oxidoreductase
MGGEGANWIGQAPFTNEAHVFQNLGDGTYYHSGLLAIRAAAAARVNITYKILFNDAIAMTGGQPHDGPLDPALISRQVAAEGARKIVVVTDEPDKYPAQVDFAPGTTVRPRADLDAVQRELRQVPGLTVLIYDQTCAAEKRRRRKRGLYPDPPKRAFINDRVCEGCGDCSEKSRCVAVKPLETEFGRKRQIDQSDCNKDFSCINGFCPSFVTVHGSGLLKRMAEPAASGGTDTDAPLPEPALPEIHGSYHILVTGIGGTGVITVGAIIGMAAHIEGKSCSVLDSTGLAQKNGAVMSHICLAARDDERHAVRIARGGADALIGCDIVVAASDEAVSRLNPRSGRAVVNEHVQPTSDFIRDADLRFDSPDLLQAIEQAASGKVETVDATGLATSLMGDAMATNLFMLGFAWQKGVIPLSMASLIRAIELNGVAVDVNKRTFAWGRRAAVDLVDVIAAATPKRNPPPVPMTLDAVIEHRADELVRYQSAAYADRYRALVAATDQTDEAPGCEFSMAVARNLYKLMAYKDEYEVARLFSDGEFRRKLSRQFAPGYKLEFHLAPPLLAKRDPVTQELKKRSYGSWLLPAFGLLARAKILRGTWADPFGYTRERRLERQLVIDYEAMIRKIAGRLTADNREIAIKLAEIPQLIRGYGHVKDRHLTAALKQRDALLQEFERVNSGQVSRGSADPSALAVSSG